jgi:hypothetical protein
VKPSIIGGTWNTPRNKRELTMICYRVRLAQGLSDKAVLNNLTELQEWLNMAQSKGWYCVQVRSERTGECHVLFNDGDGYKLKEGY